MNLFKNPNLLPLHNFISAIQSKLGKDKQIAIILYEIICKRK